VSILGERTYTRGEVVKLLGKIQKRMGWPVVSVGFEEEPSLALQQRTPLTPSTVDQRLAEVKRPSGTLEAAKTDPVFPAVKPSDR
jgi:hypothetical protein